MTRTFTNPAPRGRVPHRRARRALLAGKIAMGIVAVLVLAGAGYGWSAYHGLVSGLRTSNALAGESASLGGDTNILIMGLDSRLDQNGDPLPQSIYDALHAGDQQDGGYNANVLMLLHVPADGGKATSISIPRDDYVDLAGCPDKQCKGKIKQAYGLAFDAEHKKLVAQGLTDKTQLEQQSREAGRKAEIDTVRQFLGGVPVDHFAEVTLVAFFQIAQVVQPVTVCLSEDTQDSYSGANFHKGQQQINAQQAVAFVRQRRDYVHPSLNFTDLDRERRQQAFIASLAYQLKQGGAFTDPTKLQGILDVAKQNTAIDSGLDLLALAKQAANLTSGNIAFVTLPIDHFGKDPAGEDVNVVNLAQIRATVAQLLGTPTSSAPATTAAPASARPPSATVDIVNATSRNGLAAEVSQVLAAHGDTAGKATTDTRHLSHSAIYYGSGTADAATAVSSALGGLPVQPDSDVPAGHVRVVLGADFSLPATPASASVSTAPTPAPAADSGDAPSPLAGGGIPCVK